MALRLRITICVLVTLFVARASYGQGLNNPYSIDSTDLKLGLEMLGVTIYKFPVAAKDSALLNYIVDEYKGTKLIKHTNALESIRELRSIALREAIISSYQTGRDTSFFRAIVRDEPHQPI